MSEIVGADRLKDEFIRVAAHELKTPVTIMKGYAQALLQAEPNAPATQPGYWTLSTEAPTA